MKYKCKNITALYARETKKQQGICVHVFRREQYYRYTCNVILLQGDFQLLVNPYIVRLISFPI